MVKEEHWVIRSPLGSCVAIRRSSTAGAETSHISSHDKVRTTVRALRFLVRRSKEDNDEQTSTYLRTFKVGLETPKIAEKTIQQEVVVGLRKASVDQDCWVDRGSQRIVWEGIWYIGQRLESVVPPNTMRARVHPHDVFEASRRNLNIVVGVSPAAKSTHSVIVEHCRMFSIKRIWYTIVFNHQKLGKARGRTEGPIPVWGHSCVTALVPQGVFEVLDKITMPWEEHPSKVDLIKQGLGSQELPGLIDAYNRIEVHVQVNQICGNMSASQA